MTSAPSPRPAADASGDPLRQITEAIADAVIIIDAAGTVVLWNGAATRLFGVTADEGTGRPIHHFVTPFDHREAGLTHEVQARRRDGTPFPADITINPLDLDGRRLTMAILRDISRRKSIEAALQESENRHRALVDESIQGIVVHRDFKPLYGNQAYAAMHGYASPEALLRHSLLDHIIPPERHAAARERYASLMRGDQPPVQRRVQQHRRDGHSLWVDVTDRRIVWRGEPAVQVCVADVTAEAAIHRELASQATLLQETMESMDQGVLRVNRDLDIVAFNTRYLELLELPHERVQVRRPFIDVLTYDAARSFDDPCRRAEYIEDKLKPLRDGVPHRYELRRPDSRIIEVRGQPTPDGGGLRTYTDITLRYRLEEAQRELLEATPIPLVVTRQEDGLILFANYVAFDLLDLSPHDDGRPARATDLYACPADRSRLADALRTHGQVNELEAHLRARDGSDLWTLLSSRIFTYRGEKAVLTALTVINERKHLEEELVRAKERAETALAELQRAQEELVETARLASLGVLVAGVAHELNTPMGVVLTAVSHLSDQIAILAAALQSGTLQKSQFHRALGTLQEAVALAVANVDRAAGLIQSFKQIAVDQTSEERRRVNLKTCLGETLANLPPKIHQQGHAIHLDCPGDIEIDSYPGPLGQVVSNIVANATIHAFEPDRPGRIGITVSRAPDHGWAGGWTGGWAGGDGVTLVITDDGKGMAGEVRARIFEPFFTTRRAAGGTGLGLHMVHNMVTRTLMGRIRCESEPGAGTRFILWLPLDAPKAAGDRPTGERHRGATPLP